MVTTRRQSICWFRNRRIFREIYTWSSKPAARYVLPGSRLRATPTRSVPTRPSPTTLFNTKKYKASHFTDDFNCFSKDSIFYRIWFRIEFLLDSSNESPRFSRIWFNVIGSNVFLILIKRCKNTDSFFVIIHFILQFQKFTFLLQF